MVWFSYIKPTGKTIVLKPGACIRCGTFPAPSEQEMLVALEPHNVYSVTLQAVPDRSNLRGDEAEFCLIPDAAKKLRVQVVPWDEAASNGDTSSAHLPESVSTARALQINHYYQVEKLANIGSPIPCSGSAWHGCWLPSTLQRENSPHDG